jgi:hypothetical protein
MPNNFKHKYPERVGDSLVGTRYVFTLPMKDGGKEIITSEPTGQAISYWRTKLFGGIKEMGIEKSYTCLDSDPHKIIKALNKNELVMTDSGRGVLGSQVILDKIEIQAEECIVPLHIKRLEWIDVDY